MIFWAGRTCRTSFDLLLFRWQLQGKYNKFLWPNLRQTLTNTWRRRLRWWWVGWWWSSSWCGELGSSVFCTISFQFNKSGPEGLQNISRPVIPQPIPAAHFCPRPQLHPPLCHAKHIFSFCAAFCFTDFRCRLRRRFVCIELRTKNLRLLAVQAIEHTICPPCLMPTWRRDCLSAWFVIHEKAETRTFTSVSESASASAMQEQPQVSVAACGQGPFEWSESG